MGLIICLATGAILGWLDGLLPPAGRRGHLVLGILGALLGAFFLGSAFGGGNLFESQADHRTLLVSGAGALGVLLARRLLRRRRGSALPGTSDAGADTDLR